MTARLVVSGTAMVVVLAVAGALVIASGRDDASGNVGSSPAPAERPTAEVERRDLRERLEVGGTLGYGPARPLSLGRQGTVTALPAVGSVVDRGAVIGEVDGSAVRLFLGDRPLWRPLQEGVPDGADVEIVEANLVALGHASTRAVGPNRSWTQATTAAVKRWQKATGAAETGTIAPGDVVVTPEAVRVSKRIAEPGAPAGAVVEVTATHRIVSVSLAASRRQLVAVGDKVDVTLPDGASTAGTVTEIGAVAVAGQNGSGATIPVTIALDDAAAGAAYDAAPVTVHVTTSAATGVLAVPVSALLALREGGYAVERSSGELVGVEVGASADGWVEIRGDVAEGDEVVTAR